jgi:hypothetical protein
MEKITKFLIAIGTILTACGELLRQYNASQEFLRGKAEKAYPKKNG